MISQRSIVWAEHDLRNPFGKSEQSGIKKMVLTELAAYGIVTLTVRAIEQDN